MNEKNIDVNELLKNKQIIITSTKEALSDIVPIKWDDDVINNKKKIILK